MTYLQASTEFDEEVLSTLPSRDKPAKGQAWANYLDMLHRTKRITDQQAQEWDNPYYK